MHFQNEMAITVKFEFISEDTQCNGNDERANYYKQNGKAWKAFHFQFYFGWMKKDKQTNKEPSHENLLSEKFGCDIQIAVKLKRNVLDKQFLNEFIFLSWSSISFLYISNKIMISSIHADQNGN